MQLRKRQTETASVSSFQEYLQSTPTQTLETAHSYIRDEQEISNRIESDIDQMLLVLLLLLLRQGNFFISSQKVREVTKFSMSRHQLVLHERQNHVLSPGLFWRQDKLHVTSRVLIPSEVYCKQILVIVKLVWKPIICMTSLADAVTGCWTS